MSPALGSYGYALELAKSTRKHGSHRCICMVFMVRHTQSITGTVPFNLRCGNIQNSCTSQFMPRFARVVKFDKIVPATTSAPTHARCSVRLFIPWYLSSSIQLSQCFVLRGK